jgi:replicative DNA helicase
VTDTRPSHFYDPERAILGAMILDKSIFIQYRSAVNVDFFGHNLCKDLYRFMEKNFETLDEWDPIVFDSYVPSGQPLGYAEWIDLYKSKTGVKEYMKIVAMRYIARKLGDDTVLPADMKIDIVSDFVEEFKKIERVKEIKTTKSMFDDAMAQNCHFHTRD